MCPENCKGGCLNLYEYNPETNPEGLNLLEWFANYSKEAKLGDTLEIKAKIEELVKKITNDKTLLEKFKNEPVKTVESLLGIDLPDEQINKIVEGIKAKITVDKVSGAVNALGNLFGKK